VSPRAPAGVRGCAWSFPPVLLGPVRTLSPLHGMRGRAFLNRLALVPMPVPLHGYSVTFGPVTGGAPVVPQICSKHRGRERCWQVPRWAAAPSGTCHSPSAVWTCVVGTGKVHSSSGFPQCCARILVLGSCGAAMAQAQVVQWSGMVSQGLKVPGSNPGLCLGDRGRALPCPS
jgi:hypothetical protein